MKFTKSNIKEINEVLGTNYKNSDDVKLYYDIEENKEYPEWFLLKYGEELCPLKLSYLNNLPDSVLDKFKDDFDWHNYLNKNKISKEQIIKYIDYLQPEYLMSQDKLTDNEVKYFSKYFDSFRFWTFMFMVSELSELFIEKNVPLNKMNWLKLISNQKLSESFIEKYINYFDYEDILAYQNVSENFKNKYSYLA